MNHLLIANQNILEEKNMFFTSKNVGKESCVMELGRRRGNIFPKGGRAFLNTDKRPV